MRGRSIGLLLVFVFLFVFSAGSFGDASYDIIASGKGTAMIESVLYGPDMRIMVEKSGENYVYPLTRTGEAIPLQLGEGLYTIKILKNIEGNRYQVIGTESVHSIGAPSYVESAQPVYWSGSLKLMELSNALSLSEKTDTEKLREVYAYITGNISYDFDKINTLKADYIPDIDDTIDSGKGICYDYAALFAGLMRLNGIPTKLVKGYRIDLAAYHAWNEVFIEGKWHLIDTTYDAAYKSAGIEREMLQDPADYTKTKEY